MISANGASQYLDDTPATNRGPCSVRSDLVPTEESSTDTCKWNAKTCHILPNARQYFLSLRNLTFFLLLIPAVALGGRTYKVEALTVPGQSRSNAHSIAHNGNILGSATVQPFNNFKRLRWIQGVPEEIPNVAVPSGGQCINSHGNVVLGGGVSPILIKASGDVIELGTINGGAPSGAALATGINESNVAVGFGVTPSGTQGWVWSPNQGIRTTGYFPGATYTRLEGINSAGFSTGYGYNSQGQTPNSRAFRYSEANGFELLVPAAGFSEMKGIAISDSQSIVGTMELTSTGARANFIWTPLHGTQLLPNLPSNVTPVAINSANQIVGTRTQGSTRAVVHDPIEGYSILNDLIDPSTPGWNLVSAAGINNSGQIIGLGVKDGKFFGYMATPVPEPATMASIAAGVIILLRRHRPNSTL